jgi:hypothetical protein
MISNPFIETKSVAPAILDALIAAIATGVFGLVLMFHFYPPVVSDQQGPLYLNLAVLGQTVLALVRGDTCGPGLMKLVGLTCRLDYASAIIAIIEGSRPALMHVVATIAGAAAAFATSLVMIANATPKREQLRTLQGPRPLFDADGRAGMRATVGQPSEQSLWLVPHVQVNQETEGFNILCAGTHGSGKSSTIRGLAEQVVARGDHTLINCVKGDMTAGLPVGRYILVAPHDRRSAAYDIAADIRNRQHAVEFAAKAIAKAKNDPMWGDGTRALWADLTMVLVADKPGAWSWQDLRDQLLSSGTKIKEVLEKHGMASSAGRLVFGATDPEENRTTMSLLLTLWVAALTTVVPLAEAWKDVPPNRRFSLRQWFRPDTRLPRVILLQKSSEYPELSALVGSFLIDRLIGLALQPGRNRTGPAQNAPRVRLPRERQIGRCPNGPRLTLILDELPECGRLERLPNLLNIGREYGVVTIAGLQDFAQLDEVYGENWSNVMLNRFRIKLIHALDAGDTADRVGRLLGTRRVEFFGPAKRDPASGRMVQELERDIVPVFPTDRLQSELGVRRKGRRKIVRLLVMGLGNPAIVDVPLTVWRDRRRAHIPAAWVNA